MSSVTECRLACHTLAVLQGKMVQTESLQVCRNWLSGHVRVSAACPPDQLNFWLVPCMDSAQMVWIRPLGRLGPNLKVC